jgi:hypothetical protein
MRTAGLSSPHATAGCIAAVYDWSWQDAESSFRKAIKLNPAAPAPCKSILQSIGDQLVDDQPARDRRVHGQAEFVDGGCKLNAVRIYSVRTEQVVGQLVLRRKIDLGKVPGLI